MEMIDICLVGAPCGWRVFHIGASGFVKPEVQMAFARFMASPLGRGLRIILGLVLIVYGLGFVGGGTGWGLGGGGTASANPWNY